MVVIPKYPQSVFYGKMRPSIGAILRHSCRQRGVELLEGHGMADHVNLRLSVPPKFSVLRTIGFLEGKSAVRVHRELMGHRRITGLQRGLPEPNPHHCGGSTTPSCARPNGRVAIRSV